MAPEDWKPGIPTGETAPHSLITPHLSPRIPHSLLPVRNRCEAPDQKCDRDRYKQLLIEAIRGTGHLPTLGGIEYAKDILIHMDIHRAARADKSFQRFVEELFNTFGKW